MNEQSLSGIFQALSDPTRRGIVGLLRRGPQSAGELAEAFPLAKSTLSAHFTILRYAGLVDAERQGRNIVYSLTPAVLEEVVDVLNGWLETAPPASKEPPRVAVQSLPADRAHPPRHADLERTRRRGAGRALLVEGGLALLLARIAGVPAIPAGDAAGEAPPAPPTLPVADPAPGVTRMRRRGLGHFVRFNG
jgi:DNA-binding transcriptional ArsR family regulator